MNIYNQTETGTFCDRYLIKKIPNPKQLSMIFYLTVIIVVFCFIKEKSVRFYLKNS